MSESLPIDGLIGRLPTTMDAEAKQGSIDKDGFLKLLIEQLKHQDPLNPQDSTEFTAQLAQFSSLEELQNMGTLTEQGIELDAVLAQSINNTMAGNLVGKEIKAVGGELYVQDGESGTILFDLGNESADVEITIYNSDGVPVRNITENNLDAGEHKIEFDGKSNTGTTLANGTYTVEVNAIDKDGEKSSVYPYIVGVVEAVRYESTGAVLIIDGLRVEFGNVVEVREYSGDGNGDSELDPGTYSAADMISMLGL